MTAQTGESHARTVQAQTTTHIASAMQGDPHSRHHASRISADQFNSVLEYVHYYRDETGINNEVVTTVTIEVRARKIA